MQCQKYAVSYQAQVAKGCSFVVGTSPAADMQPLVDDIGQTVSSVYHMAQQCTAVAAAAVQVIVWPTAGLLFVKVAEFLFLSYVAVTMAMLLS